ncbi:MAG: TM2 domain-containing protein [Alkalispirochaetaceae bacterium]
MRRSLSTAYLFWLPSLFGVAGLHRFYLGKPFSGVVFLLTGGLFGIGTIYDAITMGSQVREAEIEDRLARPLGYDDEGDYVIKVSRGGGGRRREPENLEHVILRMAKERDGVVSPTQVALEAGCSAEEAREHLEKMVREGFAEIKVKRSGHIVYVVPDFLTPEAQADLEEF